MTSNSAAQAAAFVERYERIIEEIKGLQTDLREIGIEVKAAGLNPTLLRKWATARVNDKAAKLAAEAQELHLLGEQLHPDLFGVKG